MIPVFAALDTAVALFKRFRTLIALAPVLALCAFLWVKLYGFLWWDGAIEQRDKARAQVVQMEAASKEARAKQIALNQTNQELSQRIAADAQARHAQTSRAVSDAVANYAARNRVQNYCNRGGSGIAALPVDPGAPVDPGTDPDLVAIPRDEFEAIAKAAVRGREATSFLVELVNQGLAVEYPEPKLSPE